MYWVFGGSYPLSLPGLGPCEACLGLCGARLLPVALTVLGVWWVMPILTPWPRPL